MTTDNPTARSSDIWDDAKWYRYGFLAGVVFVVLNVISFVVPGAPPARDAAAEKFAEYFADNDSGIKIASILFAISLIFGIWWIGSLWRAIARLEPSGPRLAFIAVVGFVMSGAMAAVGQAMFVAPALRPDSLAATGEFVFSLAYSMYALVLAATAAHMLALGALVLWTKFLPVWMGYIAMVSAAAAAIATIGVGTEAAVFVVFQLIGFLVWLLWVLLASVLLYRADT